MVQVSMKHEIELAMKLLEKDIHEKQDTLIGLRQQLDEVKAINMEMYQKLQVKEGFAVKLIKRLRMREVHYQSNAAVSLLFGFFLLLRPACHLGTFTDASMISYRDVLKAVT